MLKYINNMSSIHWVLVCIAMFTLFSVGKIVAVVGIVVALIAVVIRFWSGITSTFNKLFKGENKWM